jgi:hypothetical protein
LNELVFNLDGTISEEQLAEFPEEVRQRLSSAEFVAMAKERIAEMVGSQYERTGRRETRRGPVRFMEIKSGDRLQYPNRRPDMSGRQLKRMRKAQQRRQKVNL